jgi:DNA (cytosine-5)-methyltransferase 1
MASGRRKGAARRFRVAGLFAGIGGLERGLDRAGHETTLLCEIDEGARAVLRKHFEARQHGDVATLRRLPRNVDLLVAGFPCQDLSQAGRTLGIEGSRSGLVGEVFGLLRTHAVPWLVLENVPFMLRLSRGRAMDVIVEAVEALGYHWAYRVVNSLAFGVPQRRERVLFVATLDGDPRDVLFADDAGDVVRGGVIGERACGFYWTEGTRGLGWAVDAIPTLKGGSGLGIPSPPAILCKDLRVITPDIRDAERMQGFPQDWTRPALGVGVRPGHRWKLVGNAVTVPVAHWLGKRLANPSPVGRDVERRPLPRSHSWPRAAWNVGDGRFEAVVSAFPREPPSVDLEDWLRHPGKPLSAKATSGFLSRARQASLRFPDGFLDALEEHLDSVLRRKSSSRVRPRISPRHDIRPGV